jgi:iron complex outermembrane receptor protein
MKRIDPGPMKVALSLSIAVLSTMMAANPLRAAATSQPAGPPTSQPLDGTGQKSLLGPPVKSGDDLTSLSLEDLMNVQVYSAAKHAQKAAETPAAITVLTQEDMRRSGMTTIPEMLRMVPGLDVAQINANQWAISSRGFNDLYSNKLLVLMDGRSVYTPLFSGVYWDTIDYVLPDLDRIEVVRGPGATLWGANAVNGVINITTKSARDTQGLLAEGMGGNEEQQGSVRFGGKIDDNTYFRVYSKYRRFDDFPLSNGHDENDGWQDIRGGFRIDRYATSDDTYTVQGDIDNERIGETLQFPTLAPPFRSPKAIENNDAAGNLLGRWKHTFSETSDLTVQTYYDRQVRDDVELGYALDTFDVDVQHRFAANQANEIIWGGDVRFLMDNIRNSTFGTFMPTRRDDYLVSGFIQDDFTIIPDRLHFIAGSKLEQNSYSGFEFEPSGRLLLTPNDRNTFWGAISRAVRTPSRWEQDSKLIFNTGPSPVPGLPAQTDTFGQSSFESEDLLAFETGYRVKATKTLSLDATAFFNSYDDIRGGVIGTPAFTPTPVPHLLVPVTLDNGLYGETYGAELAANWNVTSQWRLAGSYSWLDIQLHHRRGVGNTLETLFEGSSPRNQFQIRSYFDLTRNLEFNTALYYVDDLKTGHIPAYARVDAGITWRPRESLSLTLGVQNLFLNQHSEFNDGLFFTTPTQVPRTYYAQLAYQY